MHAYGAIVKSDHIATVNRRSATSSSRKSRVHDMVVDIVDSQSSYILDKKQTYMRPLRGNRTWQTLPAQSTRHQHRPFMNVHELLCPPQTLIYMHRRGIFPLRPATAINFGIPHSRSK